MIKHYSIFWGSVYITEQSNSRKTSVPAILKLAFLLCIIFILQSCASTPASRPQSILDAEYFLQQGTAAFYNDKYSVAANDFTEALKIYQSIDNQPGKFICYLNLTETSIAVGNFDMAHQLLNELKVLVTDKTQNDYRVKVVLLSVKLLFNEKNYVQAMTELQPLLPAFKTQQQVINSDGNSLKIISSMARLKVITGSTEAGLWLERFQQLLKQDNVEFLDRYSALYYRLQSRMKQNDGAYDDSKLSLDKALSIYHQLAYRRGIAASLQQMANLELEQQHFDLADNLLQRALNIHLWTMNREATMEVLALLIDINNLLGNYENVDSFTLQLDALQQDTR